MSGGKWGNPKFDVNGDFHEEGGVLRCARSGNPCGTDTIPKGTRCYCAPCHASERIKELESVGRAIIEAHHQSNVDWDAMRKLEAMIPCPNLSVGNL